MFDFGNGVLLLSAAIFTGFWFKKKGVSSDFYFAALAVLFASELSLFWSLDRVAGYPNSAHWEYLIFGYFLGFVFYAFLLLQTSYLSGKRGRLLFMVCLIMGYLSLFALPGAVARQLYGKSVVDWRAVDGRNFVVTKVKSDEIIALVLQKDFHDRDVNAAVVFRKQNDSFEFAKAVMLLESSSGTMDQQKHNIKFRKFLSKF